MGGSPDRRDGPGTVRHMARLIYSMLMSLDGYTEDEQGRSVEYIVPAHSGALARSAAASATALAATDCVRMRGT